MAAVVAAAAQAVAQVVANNIMEDEEITPQVVSNDTALEASETQPEDTAASESRYDSLFDLPDPSEIEPGSYDEMFAKALDVANEVYASNMAVLWMGATKATMRSDLMQDEKYQEFLSLWEEWKNAPRPTIEEYVDGLFRNASAEHLRGQIRNTLTSNTPVEDAMPSMVASAQGALSTTSTPIQVAANIASGPELAEDEVLSYNAYLMNVSEALERAGVDTSGDSILKLIKEVGFSSFRNFRNTMSSLIFPGRASLFNYVRYDFGNFDMREYQKMTVREQARIQREVMKRLSDKNAPSFDTLVVMSLLDPTTPPLLEEGFMFLDVVAGYAAIKNFSRTISRLWDLNMANKLIDAQRTRRATGTASAIGDRELAGEMGGRVLTGDARAARAAGTTRIDTLLEFSPIDYDKIDRTLNPNLSPSMNRSIERQRRVLYYRMVKAAQEAAQTSPGIVRTGREEEIAFQRISRTLPENATIVERTGYGVRVQIRFENASRFATREEELAAVSKHEELVLAHERALNEKDEYVQQIVEANDGVMPDARNIFDRPWVERLNELEAAVRIAESRYREAERVLDLGRAPDRIEDKFLFYTIADDITQFNGDVRTAPVTPAVTGSRLTSPDISLADIDPLPNMPAKSGGAAQLVIERTRALAGQDKLRRVFFDAIKSVYETGGANPKTAAVLIHGRNTNTVWSADELYNGIDVPNFGTIRLTKKEISAYISLRMLSDEMHRMASLMKYRELGVQGFTNEAILRISGVSRKIIFQKVDSIPGNVSRIFDDTSRTNKVIDLDSGSRAAIRQRLESGELVIAKMNKPIRIGQEGRPMDYLNYALVKNTKVRDMGPNVLPYSKGYVPTDYIDVPYVVRFTDEIFVDGAKTSKLATSRFFSKKSEAEVFAAQETMRTGKEHIVDLDRAWKQKDKDFSAEMDESLLTGLYYDSRGEPIRFGERGELAPTDDPFSAMERYLGNLAWTYPMNDYRMGVMERFQKSYQDKLVNPAEWYNPKPEFKEGVSFSEQQNITNIRDYIRNALSIAEPGERMFARITRAALEKAETMTHGEILDKARVRALYGIQDFDAFRTLRRGAFYSLLGGNPAQLIVQASQILQIMTANPINAPVVIPRLLAARIAHTISTANPNWDKTMDVLAISAMMKPEKFKDMIRGMEKTGFVHLAYTNNDLAARARGISVGGSIREAGRFARNAYTSLYTEGEIWGRLYGWVDSYTRISRKNRGQTFSGTRADLDGIFNEATRVSYNYSSANAAWWQRSDTFTQSVFNSMLQFTQPIFKFYENLFLPMIPGGKFKSRFTRVERGSIMLGHVLLFGSFGTPMWQWTQEALTDLFEKLSGKPRDEFSPETVSFITGGAIDTFASYVTQGITGEENSFPMISRRVSLANIDSFISKFDETTEPIEVILGAGAAVPLRLAKAAEYLYPVISKKAEVGELLPTDYSAIMSTVGQALSIGFSNYERARSWSKMNAIFYNEFGDYLFPLGADETNVATLKAFGISSYQELAAWETEALLSAGGTKERMAEVERKLESYMLYYYKNADLTSYKDMQVASVIINSFISELTDSKGQPEIVLQNEVRKRFLKKMLNRDTSVGKILEKLIEENINSREDVEAPVLWQYIKDDRETVYREGM